MGLLDGKVAVITGAGGGIGREYALAFAAQGAKIVVNDLGGARDGVGGDTSAASKVCEEIKSKGGQAVPNFNSVSTMEGAAAIIKTALDSFGRIDIRVNNAGILRDKTLAKMEEADWDAVIAVHMKGTFACSKFAFLAMRAKGEGGRIINTSSLAGLIGNFGQSNYGSAKAGIFGFTRVLSMEGQKYNVMCNAIAPVAVTRMTSDLPMFQSPEMEKMLSPACIAPMAVFLASDLSAGITGKVFGVQGGKLFEYRMMTSEGVVKENLWTPEEIAKAIPEITRF